MDLEKTFLKAFLKNFEEESFIVNLWDGEKVIVEECTSKEDALEEMKTMFKDRKSFERWQKNKAIKFIRKIVKKSP